MMAKFWTLFKRDLRAVTAFPRFEIVLIVSMFFFIALGSTCVIPSAPGGRMYSTSEIPVQHILEFRTRFSHLMASFLFLFAPLMITDILTGEYERGTLLTLTTYPVRRSKILTSKFAANYIFSCAMLLIPVLIGIPVAAVNDNVVVEPMMVLGFLAGILLLNLVLCSISTFMSVVSSRMLVAALASIILLIGWPQILRFLAMSLQWEGLELYSYLDAVKALIDWLIFRGESFSWYRRFSGAQIASAVTVHIAVSGACLGLGYWMFSRKEFK